MARKKSSDLTYLDDLIEIPDLQTPELTESETIEQPETVTSQEVKQNNRVTDSQSSKSSTKQASQSAKIQTPKLTGFESSDLPKYQQLERKEVRLRLDQMVELTTLTKQLNRARKGKGERLTENTLIRVAIDLLLQQSDKLSGITESELLDSVSSDVTDSD